MKRIDHIMKEMGEIATKLGCRTTGLGGKILELRKVAQIKRELEALESLTDEEQDRLCLCERYGRLNLSI